MTAAFSSFFCSSISSSRRASSSLYPRRVSISSLSCSSSACFAAASARIFSVSDAWDHLIAWSVVFAFARSLSFSSAASSSWSFAISLMSLTVRSLPHIENASLFVRFPMLSLTWFAKFISSAVKSWSLSFMSVIFSPICVYLSATLSAVSLLRSLSFFVTSARSSSQSLSFLIVSVYSFCSSSWAFISSLMTFWAFLRESFWSCSFSLAAAFSAAARSPDPFFESFVSCASLFVSSKLSSLVELSFASASRITRSVSSAPISLTFLARSSFALISSRIALFLSSAIFWLVCTNSLYCSSPPPGVIRPSLTAHRSISNPNFLAKFETPLLALLRKSSSFWIQTLRASAILLGIFLKATPTLFASIPAFVYISLNTPTMLLPAICMPPMSFWVPSTRLFIKKVIHAWSNLKPP